MSSSSDQTISQQPNSSSHEITPYTADEKKDEVVSTDRNEQTPVLDNDAINPISQQPDDITSDPSQKDTDNVDSVDNVDTAEEEDKVVSTDQIEQTPVLGNDAINPISQQSDDITSDPSQKDADNVDSADNVDTAEEDKYVSTDQIEQTPVLDNDAINPISQQPDEVTSDPNQKNADNVDTAEEDKIVSTDQIEQTQTQVLDNDAFNAISQQSDKITSDPNQDSSGNVDSTGNVNTTGNVNSADEEDKVVSTDQNAQVLDDDGIHPVSHQSDEITSDPKIEDADNVDSTDKKQLASDEPYPPAIPLPNGIDHNSNTIKPERDSDALIVLVRRELEYIKETAKMLGVYGDVVKRSLHGSDSKIGELDNSLSDAIDDKDSDEVARDKRIRDVQKEIRVFKKHLRKLKLTIPPKFKVNAADGPELEKYLSESTQNVKLYTSDNKQIKGKLDLFKEKLNHEYRSAFKDFELRYKALDNRMKLCLLCFSAIPEHEVIKKRLMVYWWIGEGFIIPETEAEEIQDLEQLGAKTFNDLLDKHFIYSADGKDSQEVDNCKMQPFVRWAVIYMAQRAKFFEFDHDGSPTEDYSSCFRACLSGNGLDTQKAPDLEKLHMLLNVNEAILELKPEWLLKMRNISILCLGRWQAASEHHIEVEDTKFLQGLKNMMHLRYLSLQGISRITELPNSVSCLTKLTMLDLRACHNLEIIPRDIGLLKMLTHLDLSECYLLTQMPKGLSKLVNLVVLKGFLVVDDAKKEKLCTLEDLAKLKNLRKLSIFTGVEAFPGSKDLIAFRNFEVLHKLKIVWGGKKAIKGQPVKPVMGETNAVGDAPKGVSNEVIHDGILSKGNTETPANIDKKKKKKSKKSAPEEVDRSKLGLPLELKKLDLQCYPLESAPDWLKPSKLLKLKKLYIRGGKLRDLNLTNDNWEVEPWNVETLRLKYLRLGMNWTELLELFPKMIYLEKVRCTKLTLFPCNDKGIWVNKAKLLK